MVKSKRLKMGQLEARVLDVLWDHGGWLNPGEVHRLLPTDHELAYTTVMTILVRLHDKGLLDRHRDGRAYVYHPVLTRDEHAAARMAEFLASAGDRSQALNRFIAAITPEERAQLRRMLRPEP
jgi:predicted transcriptional regulator